MYLACDCDTGVDVGELPWNQLPKKFQHCQNSAPLLPSTANGQASKRSLGGDDVDSTGMIIQDG